MKSILFFLFILAQSICFTQLWTQKSNFGGVGRHRSFGISIGNKGYIGTGHVNGTGTNISYKDWWQYDPATNSWTQKADYPVPNYGVVGWGSATRGYAGGGVAYTNQMHEYNPVANTWTPIANCPFNIGEKQAFEVQEKGYVFGNNELAEYTPVSDTWMLKSNCPISLSSWACSFGTSTSGFVKSGSAFYEYKPSNDSWIVRASFPGSSSNGSSAFSIHQKGYVVCGYVGGLSTVTDEVWEFRPATNSWEQVNSFSGANRRFPVAFSIGDVGYFGTGTNGINFNDFYRFYYPILKTEQLELSEKQILIYPVPAADKVWIDIDSADESVLYNCKVKLFASNGNCLRNQPIHSKIIEIQRGQLPSGTYYFSIEQDDRVVQSGKIIFNSINEK